MEVKILRSWRHTNIYTLRAPPNFEKTYRCCAWMLLKIRWFIARLFHDIKSPLQKCEQGLGVNEGRCAPKSEKFWEVKFVSFFINKKNRIELAPKWKKHFKKTYWFYSCKVVILVVLLFLFESTVWRMGTYIKSYVRPKKHSF